MTIEYDKEPANIPLEIYKTCGIWLEISSLDIPVKE